MSARIFHHRNLFYIYRYIFLFIYYTKRIKILYIHYNFYSFRKINKLLYILSCLIKIHNIVHNKPISVSSDV